MNNTDKAYTEGIKIKSRFGVWFENYWYHYKWHTIIALFLIVTFTVCFWSMAEKEEADITVLYAGREQISANEADAIGRVLSAVMPRDFDGNGKKYTRMVEYQILSEEQIKKEEAITDEKGFYNDVNNQHNSEKYREYYAYITNGTSSICLVDFWLYKELSDKGRLLPLSVALGEEFGYEEGVNGVRLNELDIYDEYPALHVIPGDTVVCFLRKTVVNKEENYNNETEMLRAIVGYTSDKEEAN